jgi:hypothetical protein
MFSVDNFYNYLNQYFLKNNTELKSFNTHGSRLLKDIIIPSFEVNDLPWRVSSKAVMFDQEPIELSYFEHWIDYDADDYSPGFEYSETGDLYKHLNQTDFILRHFSGVYNPILCHSEINSPEVELFKQHHFHPVHYFYHGLIARDWFRHWKHYNMDRATTSMRFGMYSRDASGSRKYRLDLARKLIPFKDNLYFKLQDPMLELDSELALHFDTSNTEYSSDSSAMIVPEDTKKFDIQIVPETLFNTQKTHLTEKVFKPIVMGQPFIIAGCPGSLQYLKSYGFTTFGDLWDESYDEEMDADKRMDKIIGVVKYISELPDNEYKNLMDLIQHRVRSNRNHFFSEEFENHLLGELFSNLTEAIRNRNKEFYTMPGGTWFMYLDQLHKDGHDITNFNRAHNIKIIDYLMEHEPEVAKAVLTKYGHLVSP